MIDNPRNNPTEVHRPWAGLGLGITRKCMGCDANRGALGGRGAGVRWRCHHCVSAARVAA